MRALYKPRDGVSPPRDRGSGQIKHLQPFTVTGGTRDTMISNKYLRPFI
jgi:hypothetical protein